MPTKMRSVSLIVGLILALDQATKVLVSHTLILHEPVPVIESFFALTYERNTGAAFSLFAQTPAWFRQPFFLITSGVAVVALLLFLRKIEETNRLMVFAIAAVLGGAVGNLVDRLLYGEVIDFLLFHWRGYYWPAFNVADSCITLGVLGLLWSSLRENRPKGKNGLFAS